MKNGMVHCKLNHLYKFSSVAAIFNRARVNGIGKRGYEIVNTAIPALTYAEKTYHLVTAKILY
jgi:hypothetical protein